MIRVSIQLHISRGIFVYGEIIKMHTIYEHNHIVIKLPRGGNNKAKKTNKTLFGLQTLSSTTNVIDALDHFYNKLSIRRLIQENAG